MLAAVDLETTGRLAGVHEVVEIAVVPLDGGQPFHRFIKPYRKFEPDAFRTNGLSLERLADEPDAEEVADWLHEWVDRHGRIIMVAHNLSFEYSFLNALLGPARYSQLFSPHSRCTLQMALDRGFQRAGLSVLCKHFGIALDYPHCALYDAIAGGKLFDELVKVGITAKGSR